MFDELGRTSKRALIISGGLLVHLPADEVWALATDLARQPSFSAWATDLTLYLSFWDTKAASS